MNASRSRAVAVALAVLLALLAPPVPTASSGSAPPKPAPPYPSTMPSTSAISGFLTERGRIVLERILRTIEQEAQHGGPFTGWAPTYGGVWDALDLSPQETKLLEELLRESRTWWSDRRSEIRLLPVDDLEESDPRLLAELRKLGTVKKGSTVVVQSVGRNEPSNTSAEEIEQFKEWRAAKGLTTGHGRLILHAERILLKDLVAVKAIVQGIRAGRDRKQTLAALEKWNRALMDLDKPDKIRDALQSGEHLGTGHTDLPPSATVSKQPCTQNEGCKKIAPDAAYLTVYETGGGTTMAIETALSYAQLLLHRIDISLDRGNESEAGRYGLALRAVAQGVASEGRSGKGDTVRKWERTRVLLRDALDEADVKLRARGEGKTADAVHTALRVLNPKANSRQRQQERANEIKEGPDKNLGLKPACEMPAVGMAAVAAPACKSTNSGGLTKALASADLGGVDFSTVEMRYFSDGSDGVKYSFAGRPGANSGFASAVDAVTAGTADLRTWLALEPSAFWVNLSPTEPNRVIDPAFAQTNAGRALLEADLRLKRTEGGLLDPGTRIGARYWNAITGGNERACFSSRMWIVPGDVQVKEEGDALYVLEAPLAVRAKSEDIGGARPCVNDPATAARHERLQRTLVIPEITRVVNTAPEYAALRRAFLARVIAEWIRERHAGGRCTSFGDLIDSGDLGPARREDGWRPQHVFDAYVKSIRDGEFTYRRSTVQGNTRITYTLTFGGVDFSKLTMNSIGADQMRARHPHLPQAVKASSDRPATTPDGRIWLGRTSEPPSPDRFGALRRAFSGRTSLLVLVGAALVIVLFGLGRAPGRRSSSSNGES